jgi:hypothetical protein
MVPKTECSKKGALFRRESGRFSTGWGGVVQTEQNGWPAQGHAWLLAGLSWLVKRNHLIARALIAAGKDRRHKIEIVLY